MYPFYRNNLASQAPWILIEDRPVKAGLNESQCGFLFPLPLFPSAGRTTAGKWYRAVTPHVRSEDASLKCGCEQSGVQEKRSDR